MIITKEKLALPLDEIKYITINPIIKQSNEFIPTYNTLYVFDENIIPLLTSLFEKSPKLISSKIYNCIDSIQIFTKYINNDKNDTLQSKLSYPSFYNDLQNGNLNYYDNHKEYKNVKTLKTIIEKGLITRIYNYDDIKKTNYDPENNNYVNFLNDIINEEEHLKFIWQWDNYNTTFEIVIYNGNTCNNGNTGNNSNTGNNHVKDKYYCKYQFNIIVIEENDFIKNKLDHINKIISFMEKLKSTINLS